METYGHRELCDHLDLAFETKTYSFIVDDVGFISKFTPIFRVERVLDKLYTTLLR